MADGAENRDSAIIRWLALAPALAAAGVAVLYTTGALIKTAQLRGAGLNVRDTLPLVPVEQLLALGIGTMTTSLLVILVWLAILGGFVYFDRWRRARGHVPTPIPAIPLPPRKLLIVRTLLVLFLLGLVLSSLSFLPLLAWIALTAPSMAINVALDARDRGDMRRAVAAIVVGYFVVVGAGLANTFVEPPLLPQATVVSDSRGVTGQLVVASGDVWYIARSDGSISPVRLEETRTASIKSRSRPDDRRSFIDSVRDWWRDR